MHFGRFSSASSYCYCFFSFHLFSLSRLFRKRKIRRSRGSETLSERVQQENGLMLLFLLLLLLPLSALLFLRPIPFLPKAWKKRYLVNDFLFVNKMSYGPRIPQTPISFPFVHNIMPFSTTDTFLYHPCSSCRISGYLAFRT